VFTGWKDMDQYMRDNKVEGIRSTIAQPAAGADMITEAKTEEAPAAASKSGKSSGK
jgi:hypothetical protein